MVRKPTLRDGPGDRAAGTNRGRVGAVRDRVIPSAALLPILGLYVLTAVLVQATPGDERDYLTYARDITHGFYAQTHGGNPATYLWHGPGLPVLLSPLVAIGAPLGVLRMVAGPLLLFATIVVFHRLMRLSLRPRGALIATYALAAYLPFFTLIGTVVVEPLATLWLTLAAYFSVRSCRGAGRDHLWAGLALAALAMTRLEYGYVLLAGLLLSVIWMLVSRRSAIARRGTVTMVVAMLACTPWLIYTYSLTGRPLYWSNAGGLSLFWMSAPGTVGDWHGQDVFTTPQLAGYQPLFARLFRSSPAAQDARLYHLAWQNIKRDPQQYLSNVVNNIDRLVFNSPYSFTSEKASSMLYAVPNALLLAALLAAFVIAVAVRRRLAPEVAPLAALLALGFAVHVPVAAYGRFVIPLVPAAMWLAIAVIAAHVRLATASGDRHGSTARTGIQSEPGAATAAA